MAANGGTARCRCAAPLLKDVEGDLASGVEAASMALMGGGQSCAFSLSAWAASLAAAAVAGSAARFFLSPRCRPPRGVYSATRGDRFCWMARRSPLLLRSAAPLRGEE